MAKIVGIGANVCDTLITVPYFPKEDTKLKAESIMLSGGGPCATGLVAASKLGGDCGYIGAVTDDSAGEFLKSDLSKYNVSLDNVVIYHGYTSFSSYILLSEKDATRTCVFDRGNIPEWQLNESQQKAVANAQILMIDGNNMAAAVEGCKIAKANNTKVLYDAGGLYDGVEQLLNLTDILIPSEEFALGHTNTETPEEAAKILYKKYNPEIVVITCGVKGGIIYDGNSVKTYPAFLVDAVDSNGSGDVFHGAFAFAISKKMSYNNACIFSSAVSALKCTKKGARNGAPNYSEVINFLKERGYNEFKENLE